MNDDDMIRKLEKTIAALRHEICNPFSLPPWLWARTVLVFYGLPDVIAHVADLEEQCD